LKFGIFEFANTVFFNNFGMFKNIFSNTNMKKNLLIILFILCGLHNHIYGQTVPNFNISYNSEGKIDNFMLKLDSVFNKPYIEDFENNTNFWSAYTETSGQLLVWQLGNGYRHHLEGAHSGKKAWHTSKSIEYNYASCTYNCNMQYAESPYIDLSSGTANLVLNLWFKDQISSNSYSIQYSNNYGSSWNDIYTFSACREDDWDFINVSINTLSLNNHVKFRIKYATSYLKPEGIIFDDFYIGDKKPDLSIEGDKTDRFTSSTINTDTIKYNLSNCGLGIAQQTITAFYWSNDTILDATDILLGTKQEQLLSDTTRIGTNFIYTKPTSSPGKYYVFYVIDTAHVLYEMREYNNLGYFTLHQDNSLSIPYFNDFESQINGWRHNASIGKDDWKWTVPHKIILDTAFSGTKAWITNDTGLVSPMSRMHLYTPVFDLSSSINPVLEFDMKLHSDQNCHCFEGKMNMSFSTDGGATWVVLDTTNKSYNRWYYTMEYNSGIDANYYMPNYSIILNAPNERVFPTFYEYNSRDVKRNTRYIIDLSFLAGVKQIQFRFNLATLVNNSQSPNYPVEGALIDDFFIREAFVDFNVDYKKALMISSIAQKIKFFMHIKNQGNYISLPSITNYYLSTDTILDGSDYNLGLVNIPAIRPDMYSYVNLAFNAPANLSDYHYLLYKLDATNTNSESNEFNNLGYWKLALDSIKNYPYFNDFNDSIINGWHQYSIGPNSSNIGNYRIRNMISPGEPLYQTEIRSGEMFTERVPSGSWLNPPYYYLETPVFNFTKIDSVFLSFDLMCSGRTSNNYQDGGNFQFSTNGGNTWNILTSTYGQAYNWYNYAILNDLDNEPGWAQVPNGNLDSTSFDISFLKGKNNVKFRYKYKSNHEYFGGGTVQGLRIDNFMIQGFGVDYIANDSMVLVNANPAQSFININYSISNSGQTNGRITTTKFYWSNDSIFDNSDLLVKSISESPILSGNTSNLSTTINYPLPINQTSYYLFYKVDANSNLFETNESNNMGSFKITFTTSANYYANIKWDSIDVFSAQPTFDVNYSIINNGISDGVNSITSFYWSTDSILDAGDQNIKTLNEGPINSGDTLISLTTIAYPPPLTQSVYYLFYKADSNDEISEFNENDNTGVFKLIIDNPNNFFSGFPSENIDMFLYGKYIYLNIPKNLNDYSFNLKIINMNGQIVYNTDFLFNIGLNSIFLPNNLPNGIYVIRLNNSKDILIKKAIIQN
jgi:hypothetical protein